LVSKSERKRRVGRLGADGKIIKKSKAVPLHHAGAKGERKYSFYSFVTSALDKGEWSASCLGHALHLIPIG
jgi:hypothetical protein